MDEVSSIFILLFVSVCLLPVIQPAGMSWFSKQRTVYSREQL
jgi:hypothetical protein